jgi:uncharacterized protein (DUF2141 family)
LHRTKETFPDDWEKTIVKRIPNLKQEPPHVVFSGLKPGVYAIIVVHDEDKNGKMTKNFLGFPRECFGTSNNPTFWGPPASHRRGLILNRIKVLPLN